ncbi:sigma-70 family rna polymerase sigma factor : Uncultured bacterium genome assembly Metasoil_fosmids_resub OS=uncultured bacterium PE=4 SV=1: Sigma70_r2: Sigma70_r4_2: WD40 [Gemmata massiliana]|uniref:Uncharacterized protein n=1 Tax=Gemmata massiliana TaxID=1210884 RepID=A0A6P2D1E2_9BACT|nr:sigma-70 family rna polymerase sigma factor : Uncultured bacterium genome assembly Metasoil_fosmids_resub OS=uncultured bacterium PE=4 SV=1: Sigma70_r2: Sigma70_r4_2: WD40 [Gemmata massiliana]
MWRHGAMVWGACRRVLDPDRAAAEDACQAAFVALAEHAARLRVRPALAAWLHRVAVRAAFDLSAARRSAHRLSAAHPDAPDRRPGPFREACAREVRALLDSGLNRLPDKLRLPFVLCELEGRTNAEAAAELGCPVGTVESRLTRARQRLRAWLTARGVVPASAGAAVALPESARAAMVRAARPAALSPTVRALAARATPAVVSANLRVALAVGLSVVCTVGLVLTANEPARTPPALTRHADTMPLPATAREGDQVPLPAGAVARLGSPHLRHGGWVYDICFSADGARIASTGSDGTVCVWDGATGKRLFIVRRKEGGFNRVAFAPGARSWPQGRAHR